MSSEPENVSPNVAAIADSITKLTLIETSELVSVLKSRLNLSDMPMMPMGAMMGGMGGGAGGGAAAAEEEVKAAEPEKTEFNVKLVEINAANKVKIIREVKNLLPHLNLVTAKKFVEEAPKVIKEGISKEEAEKMVKLFEELGCKIVLE
ncbi:50S ribosomal protein L7/L12 [Fonticula alba]|uniref:50S ribosomal protein L7/L12 n=1 Tax=Fonticula alba TaxID=691883 RepID=A0A058ZA89_FONAL|nr:50S ribosomal protein L7/L12 [Fonticula alba]KCV71175.1 50S ribosomal protein L7/L12 [Fonticula alba]|eukprot:XP_009494298.1 50S ribosomal protein L7/L12 [Fonticula alba]